MTSPPIDLAKPKSQAFKDLYGQIKDRLDAPSLVVVLYAASERKRLEGLYSRFSSAQGPRASMLAKEELVGAIAGWFFASPDVAHALIKELDRSCKKERYIVASIPEDVLEERLQSYQGLDFQRGRAKLAWALLRDPRDKAQHLAMQIAVSLVQQSQGPTPPETATIDGDDDDKWRALRDKINAYESMVDQARGRLQGLEGQVAQLEKERAELMANLGRKESALRAEEKLRRNLEGQLTSLRKALKAAQDQLSQIDPQEQRRLSAERDKLANKLRRLEKKIIDQDLVDSLRHENQELRAQLEQAQDQQSHSRQERQQLLQSLVARDKATHERLGRMRQALKTARRMAAEQGPREANKPIATDERVGIFVDAANISASAKRAQGGQFDFGALLDLVGQRSLVLALAYVVDNGQEGFLAFANALRTMGFKVKIKKPSRRPDGSIKADWDMAIAMDIVDARHQLDTVLIASGDGDFVPLVRRLKRWRKRVEVAAFAHAIHPELRRCADQPIELGAAQIIGGAK